MFRCANFTGISSWSLSGRARAKWNDSGSCETWGELGTRGQSSRFRPSPVSGPPSKFEVGPLNRFNTCIEPIQCPNPAPQSPRLSIRKTLHLPLSLVPSSFAVCFTARRRHHVSWKIPPPSPIGLPVVTCHVKFGRQRRLILPSPAWPVRPIPRNPQHPASVLSATYELQILKVPCFHIQVNCRGCTTVQPGHRPNSPLVIHLIFLGFQSLTHSFALFKNATLLFSSHSALFVENTRGGVPLPGQTLMNMNLLHNKTVEQDGDVNAPLYKKEGN